MHEFGLNGLNGLNGVKSGLRTAAGFAIKK
jgi:hypothetical protein